MNPSYRKSAKDSKNIRANYLSNLALEASNNQKNLNANRIYKETGQTPTQKTDERNKTEIYAGLEGMKQLIRDTLSGNGIMNAIEASQAVAQMDEEDIEFFGKYKDYILTDFKARGVPATVFVNYLRRLRQKTNETHGVEFNLQQDIGHEIRDNILALTGEVGELSSELALTTGNVGKTTKRLDNLLEGVVKMYPSEEERRIMTEAANGQFAGEIDEIGTAFQQATRDLPDGQELNELKRRWQEASSTGDIKEQQRVSVAIADQCSLTAEQKQSRAIAKRLVLELKAKMRKAPKQIESTNPVDIAGEQKQGTPAKPQTGPPQGKNLYESFQELRQLSQGGADYFEREFNGLTADEVRVKLLSIIDERTGNPLEVLSLDEIAAAYSLSVEAMLSLILDTLIRHEQKVRGGPAGFAPPEEETKNPDGSPLSSGNTGRGMRGRGVGTRARKSAAERSTGYKKPPAYKQLGRYLINHHKLNDGVLMVKTPSGSGVKELPTEAISSKLAETMKHISYGQTPPLDLYEELNADDKEKLHHIVRHSRAEGIKVPNPSKNTQEADMNRFQILKGEIIAGNDSKEVAREFKVLLMKLMREGRVPRRQGNEILEDMLRFGH
jgi:hypothetical protein